MFKKFITYNLAKELYGICKNLKMPMHLKDQLMRASSSVVLNLAEGSGKETRKDKRKFFVISFGSLREVSSILDLAEVKNPKTLELLDKTSAHLYKLIQYHK
ncbi:MAG: four helix bundle protein [Bacteriovoracaceae bacterium]|nr:four helix bundle protein [Bacteriovoracaceae bacterium]